MAGRREPGTPLTACQARALAQWWGGTYLEVEGRHLVVLAGFPEPVATREQAREVESRRPEVNPGAVDWVG